MARPGTHPQRARKLVAVCQQPDRHVAALVCGYPLPCPHHSVFVVVNKRRKAVRR